MAQPQELQADGYYGDDDMTTAEELDVSFLDDDEPKKQK